MSYVIAVPNIIRSAATDLAVIGSNVTTANAAAATHTTGMLAAAGDEVSAALAALFSAHARSFQALSTQAAAFHDQFVRALTAGEQSYVSAEGANVAAFLADPEKSIEQVLLSAINATNSATPAATIGLVMGPSGVPIPGSGFVKLADELYIQLAQNFPGTTYPAPYANGLFTPEYPAIAVPFGQNYPTATTGPLAGFPAPSTSVGQGMLILENSILSNVAAGNVSTVFGWSQSATISGLVMQQLSQPPFSVPNNLLQFLLVGDPNAPNGGLAERFVGLNLASLGISFDGATPANLFPTRIYSLEYDGFADFPRYPIDVFADLNAALGVVETHGLYLSLPPTAINNAIELPQSGSPSMTRYYMIPLSQLPYPENYLPLLQPLLNIPVVGKPLADLLQPDLTALVNWGYGDPNVGWSTSPADVPTPFGFLPPMSATMALGPLLASGTQQGVNAFVSDLQNLPLSSMVPAAPSMSSLTNLLPAMSTAVSDPGATLTRVVNGFSGATSSLFGFGLQTADIVTGAVTDIPAYDASLFLANLSNPVDAIGLPVAADVGLFTVGGLVEFALGVQAAGSALDDILGAVL